MNKSLLLPESIYRYILANTLREPPLLRQLREETMNMPQAHMQVAPDQGQFMALLVKLMLARKTLELGVYTGYSALSVALALPAGGHLLACDISRKWTDVARRYWRAAGVEQKIELALAPASQTLERLLLQGEAGTFDFAFIDADKKRYELYYEQSLKLVRAGGVILIDNTLRAGLVADPGNRLDEVEAMRKFNEKLLHDERIELSLLPMGDGLTLALKRG